MTPATSRHVSTSPSQQQAIGPPAPTRTMSSYYIPPRYHAKSPNATHGTTPSTAHERTVPQHVTRSTSPAVRHPQHVTLKSGRCESRQGPESASTARNTHSNSSFCSEITRAISRMCADPEPLSSAPGARPTSAKRNDSNHAKSTFSSLGTRVRFLSGPFTKAPSACRSRRRCARQTRA
jgi:hypothetical protein